MTFAFFQGRTTTTTTPWRLLSWSCFLLLHGSPAWCQQAANPDLQLDLFSYPENLTIPSPLATSPQTFRHNFCALNDAVQVQNVTLDVALQGVQIHVALMEGDFVRFTTNVNEQTGETYRVLDPVFPGLVPRLLDELCLRAGCTWRNTYAALSYDQLADFPDQSFSDLLAWSTDVYDLQAEWWMRSVDRLRDGATFCEPWYDGTIIMVAPKPQAEKDTFDPTSFLDPFDSMVWIMVGVTVLASASIHALLRYLDPHKDPDDDTPDWTELLWKYATAFAGQFEFEPHNGPTRLFTFSIGFWALLMTAAYTANLASFLVIRNTPTLRIESLQQAVSLNKRLCIWKGSGTDATITQAFPTFSASDRFVRTSTAKGVLQGLQEGTCDIAITEVSTWDVFQTDADVNGDCSLTWIGRPFQNFPASFAVKGDAGTLCTSLLRDVFNLYLHAMEADKKMETLWEEHIEQQATVSCTAEDTEADTERRRRRLMQASPRGDENANSRRLKAASNAASEGGGEDLETTRLTLTNMGGVFLLHGILSVLALLLAVAPRLWHKNETTNEKPKALEKPKEEDDDSAHSLYYFDAEGGPKEGSLDALRAEMNTKLASIEEKLAALLNKQ